ncbi:hypothetical protein JVT61DRAFT_10924 [Boletus reticuloceps]|uniref:Rhodopsin domain-containing protein n=1 Tax=Boletus reticuloceps TaxID=495285 RepID=A0A8I2YFI4_9AGAM|nr:hypothetical protein JVT61DRAFT_10924 [Boletus reticuloceps]
MSKSERPSPETVSALLILVTVFHALALILTSFRLWFRYYIRRLWWDDFWAAFALICDAVCMVTAWTLTAPLDNPYTNVEALPTPAQSRTVHIISYWLSVLLYTCSIWFARISIIFSVARIVPPARSVTMMTLGAGVVLACMWAYIFTSKAVACGVDRSWYDAAVIQCPVPNWVALSEVCTDTVSDAILVALPFRFLRHVKIPSNQRIMLLSVFSTSILVSVVSAVHTAYLIPTANFIGGVTAEMEGAVSLIVCNLLVIVTFIYRVLRNGRDLTAGLSDKHTQPSHRLTTVDLDVSGGSLFTRTGAETVGTGFTGTQLTETDVSSLEFTSMGDMETTFGFIVVTGAGGSVPRAMTASRGVEPMSMISAIKTHR